jgi:YbbR domain-containing protein
MENWWLKVAALFLAYVIWVLMRSGEGERVFTVPLIVQVPRNMEIVSDHPATVEVATLGTSDLAGTAPNLAYTIDLREEREGERTIDLSPAGLGISPASGLSVVSIHPAKITLVMERVISKEVPVRVSIQGKPDAGFEYYGATCRPDRVLLLGPRSQISPIQEVPTDPIVIAGKNRSFQTTVNFSLQGDDIHTSPATAEVAVELGVHRNEQIVRIPITLPDGGEYAARPAFVTVYVLVPGMFRRKLSAADFRAVVMPNRRPGSEPTAVKLEVAFSRDLGAGIAIRRIDPEEVILLRKSGKK